MPIVILASASAFAQSGPTDTDGVKAVKHCVSVVHNTHSPDQYEQHFYQHFDAFYNPATGVVQNNAKFVGDQDPLFIFNKCMSENGFPMTDVPKK
jgi:hypothetical protein